MNNHRLSCYSPILGYLNVGNKVSGAIHQYRVADGRVKKVAIFNPKHALVNIWENSPTCCICHLQYMAQDQLRHNSKAKLSWDRLRLEHAQVLKDEAVVLTKKRVADYLNG